MARAAIWRSSLAFLPRYCFPRRPAISSIRPGLSSSPALHIQPKQRCRPSPFCNEPQASALLCQSASNLKSFSPMNERVGCSVLPAPHVACRTDVLHVIHHCSVLSWLNFTVTLSALAAGLLNFGDKIGRVSAAMFSFVGKF